MTTRLSIFPMLLAGLLVTLAAMPVTAETALILPHPSLLRAQQVLRQAEQEGAAALQPGAVLAVQEKINAAWSAYHLQVEEEADESDDEEAILARHLAEEVELDAELLLVMLRTQDDEARLDGLRASQGLPPVDRQKAPPPGAPAAVRPR